MVTYDTEPKDEHGEKVTSVTRVSGKEEGDGLFPVLCALAVGQHRWVSESPKGDIPLRATRFHAVGLNVMERSEM